MAALPLLQRWPVDLNWRGMLGSGALLLALLLLTGSAIALNRSLASLAESRAQVIRTNVILTDLAELQTTIRAAETGQRGYLLTGEHRYLVPYEQALGRVWTEFEELERWVQHPGQQDRLGKLQPLLQAKIEELAQTVALRSQSLEAALAVVRTDTGQKLMEEIDKLITNFREVEQDLLEERTQRLEGTAAWTARITALTGGMAVFSAVLGVIGIARQRAQTRLLASERQFRQELERRVEERTAELTEVNRELDAFAYTISHDLRAPLRAMHGYSDALEEDYGPVLPQEGRQFTRRIAAAAQRMEDLIEDILAYSRLARAEVSLRPVALTNIVNKVLADLKRTNENAEIEVVHPLPVVQAHPPLLAQVITNLLSNALKFTAPGEMAQVRVRAERRDGMVRLSVEDRGIGVSRDHQERIFKAFERLHGVETYPGTGIGLAIVRRAMERMQGTCGVVSEPGKGSQFWIELRGVEEGQL